MLRTVVSLEEEDKAWLDRKADEEQVSMAEMVRRAVRRLREETDPATRSLEQILEQTAGIWKGGDALEYQLRVRGEWEDR